MHLANNLFKLALVGRDADWGVVLRFSVPAALAAIGGASTLALVAGLPAIVQYEVAGRTHEISLLKFVIGALIVSFALFEFSPRFAAAAFPARYLVLGGLLSGFFGGLSGNQGAFRSAFLVKVGLSKKAFIGTGAVSTVIVDTVRLLVYGATFYAASWQALPSELIAVVALAMLSAFTGAYLGARLMQKVTLRFVQIVVATMMVLVGAGLASGLL